MGTFVKISLDEKNIKFMEKGFDVFSNVEKSLSSYDEDALVYRLNRDKKVSLDPYLYEALSLSKAYYERSDAYFDITVGSITKDLFSFGENEKLPSSEDLRNATLDINGLHFNKHKATLEKSLKIDLGGMGKGFGVDKVAEYFREVGAYEAIISASGDIRCLSECRVEVQDPFSDSTLLSFETLHKDMAISTSGNYNRYVKSTKNNHLINPKLKRPQDKFISITLIGSMKNSDLDAYATASSVMPLKKAYEFLDSLDLAYITMNSDGKLRFSTNLMSKIKNLRMNDTTKK